MKDVAVSEIEAKLRITYEQAEDVFDYLRGQGLVEVEGNGGSDRPHARGSGGRRERSAPTVAGQPGWVPGLRQAVP
jgi:hypothetical protein